MYFNASLPVASIQLVKQQPFLSGQHEWEQSQHAHQYSGKLRQFTKAGLPNQSIRTKNIKSYDFIIKLWEKVTYLTSIGVNAGSKTYRAALVRSASVAPLCASTRTRRWCTYRHTTQIQTTHPAIKAGGGSSASFRRPHPSVHCRMMSTSQFLEGIDCIA